MYTTTLPDWAHGIHHDGSEAYLSNPLPKLNESVQIRLRTPLQAPIRQIYIRATINGEFYMFRMHTDHETAVAKIWQVSLIIEQPRLDYVFKLLLDDGEGSYYYHADGISRANRPDKDCFSLLAGHHAPLWVRDTIFYQIFPERFYNGDPTNDVQDNEYERRGTPSRKSEWHESPLPWHEGRSMDFFGGDLQGITQKLDYLRDLGINGIYLNPIFTAQSNHKYDIMDFFNVDKHFGGNEALVALREATQNHNIRLMLDITPNHISFQHPWYTAAEADHNADTAPYFYWNSEGFYETWLGVPSLIKLNYGSQALRDMMYRQPDSAIQHWLNPPYSVDAWRLDVANMTGNLRQHQLDHDIWREMRHSVKQHHPDVYLLGEYFQDGTPHTQGDELDAAMNYQGFNIPVRRWLGGADSHSFGTEPGGEDHTLLASDALADQWQAFIGAVPYSIALQQFNQLGSHDTTRIDYVVNGDKALVKLGTALLMAFPGVPCLYYGDEIGMTGGRDPDNRRPMIWDETHRDNDLRAYTQRVIAIRHASHAIKHGGFQVLFAQDDTIAFLRESSQQRMVYIGYRGPDKQDATRIPVYHGGLADGVTLVDQLSEATYTVQEGHITLPALQHGQSWFMAVQ